MHEIFKNILDPFSNRKFLYVEIHDSAYTQTEKNQHPSNLSELYKLSSEYYTLHYNHPTHIKHGFILFSIGPNGAFKYKADNAEVEQNGEP